MLISTSPILKLYLILAIMGAKCAVKNDTEYDVWIYSDINHECIMPDLAGVIDVITAGAGLAALGASVGVGVALLAGGALTMTEEGILMSAAAATSAGLAAGQWTLMRIITEST